MLEWCAVECSFDVLLAMSSTIFFCFSVFYRPLDVSFLLSSIVFSLFFVLQAFLPFLLFLFCFQSLDMLFGRPEDLFILSFSLLGWRPSLLGWRPSLPRWRPSTRLEAIASLAG